MMWTMALTLLKRFWPVLLAAVGVAAVTYGMYALYSAGFSAGEAKANSTWSELWEKRNTADAAATAAYEQKERAREQELQKTIEQATKDAQQKIDLAKADAAVADGASKRLQQRADAIATQLASSKASLGACSAIAGDSATQAARVYADVLKRLDDRAGKLAAVADEAIERGNACTTAYNSMRNR